jgi:hypothetical protein
MTAFGMTRFSLKKKIPPFFIKRYGHFQNNISLKTIINKLLIVKTIVNDTKALNIGGGRLPLAPGFRRFAPAIRGHTPSLAPVLS